MSEGSTDEPEDTPDDVLDVETSDGPEGSTVTVRGEVDAHTADSLRHHLDGLGAGTVVRLDLSGVGFMDSSGLRVLIAAKRRAVEGGGDVKVVAASRPLTRLFEIAGVADHLGLDAHGDES
jgi:anti-sigma B factor antagonist